MSARTAGWNDGSRVVEPQNMQQTVQHSLRKYEIIGLVDGDRRFVQDCNRFQIIRADVNHWTITGNKELERRLQNHLNGTLPYCYMTTGKLCSIISARGLNAPDGAAYSEPYRAQLIHLIQDSDAAAGPFKVLDLPLELRAEIYSYVLPSELETSCSTGPGPVLPDLPPLLFVNRQVRSEVGGMFMRSRPIVLPCTGNVDSSQSSALEPTQVKISAGEETLEWLRMAGTDLLPQIRSCLMFYRVSGLTRQSYVYDIDPIDGSSVYNIRRLGQIEGRPLFDGRGLYLLNPCTTMQGQLHIQAEEASKLKLSKNKARRIAGSFRSWEMETWEDIQRSKFYGAAILLNWL